MAYYVNENGGLYSSVSERRIVFFLVFMGVLSLTYAFFFSIDFLPEKPDEAALTNVADSTGSNEVLSPVTARGTEEKEITDAESADYTSGVATDSDVSVKLPTDASALPVAIIFDTLDREVRILNPDSSSVEALDQALLSGVVRYPGSGDFVNKGTIFLLGHSSYLPNVINKNFQAFNGIQKLVWGDTIRLRSTDTEYVYRVDRVYQTKAAGAEIKIETGKDKLTLATCNSFGTKDDRFVVEATLINTRAL